MLMRGLLVICQPFLQLTVSPQTSPAITSSAASSWLTAHPQRADACTWCRAGPLGTSSPAQAARQGTAMAWCSPCSRATSRRGAWCPSPS